MNIFSATIFFLLIIATNCLDSKSAVLESKIIGGHLVPDSNKGFRFIASLRFCQNPDEHWCSVTLATLYHALSSASCIDPRRLKRLEILHTKFGIVVGSYNIWQGGTWYDVHKIGVGAGYSSIEFASTGDIGIMQLVDRLVITQHVATVPLLRGDIPLETPGIIAGWGLTSLHSVGTDFPISAILKQIHVKVKNITMCQEEYSIEKLASDIVCVQPDNHDEMVGQRDEGSPLIIHEAVAAIYSCGSGTKTGVPFITISTFAHIEMIEKMDQETIIRDLEECTEPQPRKSVDPRRIS